MTSIPYTGSLLRLALTLTAIFALAAGVFAFWQRGVESVQLGANSVVDSSATDLGYRVQH